MYHIAIPSYKRSATLRDKTLALLKRHGLDHKATIFIVAEDEADYRRDCPGAHLIVGVKGLVEQRRFIYNWMPERSDIVMMDDDLEDVLGMDKKSVDIAKVIESGFQACRDEHVRLWGVGSVPNPFYMKEGYSTNLKHLVGSFYGFRKWGRDPYIPTSHKEDYYRSCAYFKEDGKVIRLNWCAPKTRYYKEPGGLQETRTDALEQEGADRVAKDFPGWVSVYQRKRTGVAELKLNPRAKVDGKTRSE